MNRSWRVVCGLSLGLLAAGAACGGSTSSNPPPDAGEGDASTADGASPEAATPDSGAPDSAGAEAEASTSMDSAVTDSAPVDSGAAKDATSSDAGTATLQYASTITVPGVVSGMAYDATSDLLWVACAADPRVSGSINALVVVDASDNVTTVAGVPNPQPTLEAYRALAVAPAQHRMFTWSEPEELGAGIGVYDTSTQAYVTTVALPQISASLHIAVDAVSGSVLVLGVEFVDGGEQTVLAVVDAATSTLVGTVPLASGMPSMTLTADGAHGRAIASDGAHAYVVDEASLTLTAVVPLHAPPADAGTPDWLLAGVSALPDGNVAAFDAPNVDFQGGPAEARVFSVGASAFEHDLTLTTGFSPFYLTTAGTSAAAGTVDGGSTGGDAGASPPSWLLLGMQGSQPAVLSLEYATATQTVTNLGPVPFTGAHLPSLVNLYPRTASVLAQGAGAPRFYASFAATNSTMATPIGLARFTLVGP